MALYIPYIAVDKYVAMPYDPGTNQQNVLPDATAYYRLGIQVHNADGSLPQGAVPVYLGDDQNRNRVQYWKSDKQTNITQTVLDGGSIMSDAQGHLTVYIAITNFHYPSYPGCIFNVYASPTPDPVDYGVNQTLTCCYYTQDAASKVMDPNLEPLVLSVDGHGQVTIPAWNSFDYALSILLESPDPNVSSDAKLSIVVNGRRVDNSSYTYQSLFTGVDIPYSLMIPGNNCIVYMTDDGTPRLSKPWPFTIVGVPLLMPNPNIQNRYGLPWWFGAPPGKPPKKEPLGLSDMQDSDDGPGFDVVLAFASDVKPGDVYSVLIYMNGYTASGEPQTRMLGDGSPLPNGVGGDNLLTIIAPPNVQPGDTMSVASPIATLEGFGAKDAADPGFLFVNFQVNGQDWSAPYVGNKRPVKINFAEGT
ncbi:hypothetical protein CAL12_05315 [Bordetella genomosp. 8]|uniref:Uncharacterized protein n=1 Tax=Bordetella genomosp. 8 TaxID=1416806 RepID=A0A1W6YGS6_9BORD|nr:hypothetical protein [Bordetella genomosp. 8]ARP80306.1 hypothetical protein CAL12_05315 [Bordetella genomosp. 8]